MALTNLRRSNESEIKDLKTACLFFEATGLEINDTIEVAWQ